MWLRISRRICWPCIWQPHAAVFATATLTASLAGLANRTAEEEQLERVEWRTRSVKGMAKDLLMLTKPIVVLLLLVTTYAGMVIGAQAWPSLSLTFWTMLGGFMAAGGSGAINQYIDRKDDVRMQRTQKRPIPSGRLTPAEGLAFGVALSLGSFFIMVAFVNMLAALLSLAGIIYYVFLYSIFPQKDDSAEYRYRRWGRGNSTLGGVGGGNRQFKHPFAVFVRHCLYVDPAAFLGTSNRAPQGLRPRRGAHAPCGAR